MSNKVIIGEYVFNPVAKTVKVPQFPQLKIEGLQLITNLATGAIVYQFNSAAKGGVVSGDTITLDFDTSAMSASDPLQIIYSPPNEGTLSRMMTLLYQIVEHLRFPAWVQQTVLGAKMQAILSTDSSINTVSTVTNVGTVATVTSVTTLANQTNVGGLDARELPWALWTANFNNGIRSKII